MKTIFRFIIYVPILCSFFIGLVFFGLGVYEAIINIYAILNGKMHSDETPGIFLFQALDVFLIGFLFLIFSIGFSQLFIPKPSKALDAIYTITPSWLKVENFTQLKLILWDTVLTTLVVLFIAEAFRRNGNYNWELLIIPISIVLISFGRYLLKSPKKQ